ncbi:HEPN domain-containing protein [Pedobacter frigidisoli]|uniref:HEPN domain-containing protein n=1 Tax=Pedobacter frigidisoli TaxID=2530455 RepID=UPI00292DC5D9|nr:HEPN domain-containing protein [Pedobacter frigidisoli]
MKVKTKKLKPKNHLLFDQVIRLLVNEFSPMYIYHYATVEAKYHARSIFSDQDKRAQCTVHLLMITSGTECLESKVQDYIDRHAVGIKVIIQVHGDEIVCRNLNSSNGYFTSVVNNGKLIYVEAGEFPYAPYQPPNPRKQLVREIARWHKRYENAKTFLSAGRQSIDNGTENIGVFLLHQATEQAIVGLIYVFMGYRSDIRNLSRLLHVCACFSPQPLLHFTSATDHESLLRLMIRAFNRARYEDEFSLEGHSGYQFLELVENFLKLANGLCKESFSTKQKAIDQIALAKKEETNE